MVGADGGEEGACRVVEVVEGYRGTWAIDGRKMGDRMTLLKWCSTEEYQRTGRADVVTATIFLAVEVRINCTKSLKGAVFDNTSRGSVEVSRADGVFWEVSESDLKLLWLAHKSGLNDPSAAAVASYANHRHYSVRVEEACDIMDSLQGYTEHRLRERSARCEIAG